MDCSMAGMAMVYVRGFEFVTVGETATGTETLVTGLAAGVGRAIETLMGTDAGTETTGGVDTGRAVLVSTTGTGTAIEIDLGAVSVGVRGEAVKGMDMASIVGSKKLNKEDFTGAAVAVGAASGTATGVSITATRGVTRGVACDEAGAGTAGADGAGATTSSTAVGFAPDTGTLDPPVKNLLTAPNTPWFFSSSMRIFRTSSYSSSAYLPIPSSLSPAFRVDLLLMIKGLWVCQ